MTSTTKRNQAEDAFLCGQDIAGFESAGGDGGGVIFDDLN
jgi:hypothetical protein